MAKTKTSKSDKIREALKAKWAKKLTVAQIAKRLKLKNPGLIYAVKAYDAGKKYKAKTKTEITTNYPYPDTTVYPTEVETYHDESGTASTAPIPMSSIDLAIHTLQRAKALVKMVEES